MPENKKADELLKAARRERARYAPELSWPILDAIADMRGQLNSRVLDTIEATAAKLDTPGSVALLYADLICALNGLDWLPFISDVLLSRLWCPKVASDE